jgi:polar amino acid transport system substrate-binding protein
MPTGARADTRAWERHRVRDGGHPRGYSVGVSRTWIALAAAAVLAGCQYPADVDGSLERARGGVLRVGMSPSHPWTELDGATRAGVEVELVERFAERLRAEIEWTDGGEEDLVEALQEGDLDLVVGGITNKTPWKKKHAAPTRPYATVTGSYGSTEKHVMLVRMGENAFLLELDRFLQRREGAVRERLATEGFP